jgi:LacI family transcriptional regulator
VTLRPRNPLPEPGAPVGGPAPGRPRSGAKDVARLAGVSTATVSRTLNTPGQVDPETRDRVLQAAAKLRYVPHGAARSLRSRRSRMIGAVVPSFEYALYARTTSAMQRTFEARGYSMVLAEHRYDLAKELGIAGQLIQHGVDAFVFVGLDHDPALFALLEDYGRPYVLTWGVDPARRHPSIGFDNEAATHALTRHLIGLGHRRFGLISAPLAGNDRARARGAGVRAALAEAGLELDERNTQYGPISLRAATECMHRLLALPEPPTALCCGNDRMAVAVYGILRTRGIAVPQDMSVAGYDDYRVISETLYPQLTTMELPYARMGEAAARLMLNELRGSETVPEGTRIVVQGNLRWRDSVVPGPAFSTQ